MLRHSLTDEQFLGYLEIERSAQAEDRILAAVGVEAGVADVLTMFLAKKGTKPKAMANFIGKVGADNAGSSEATHGDSKDMSELRNRIRKLVKSGEMK